MVYFEAQPKTRHIWAPSKGVGICDGMNFTVHSKLKLTSVLTVSI